MVLHDVPFADELPHSESSPVAGLTRSVSARVLAAAACGKSAAKQAHASTATRKGSAWRTSQFVCFICRSEMERRWSRGNCCELSSASTQCRRTTYRCIAKYLGGPFHAILASCAQEMATAWGCIVCRRRGSANDAWTRSPKAGGINRRCLLARLQQV